MQKRTSLQIQVAVIHTLFIRELKTRFGTYKLGYIWAVLEPLLQILFFMALFSFMDRSSVGGLELPIFLATGIAPFLYFNKVISQCMGAISGNRSLLIYRQIRAFDTFLVRFLLEILVAIFTITLFILGAWHIGYEVKIANSFIFIEAFILLSLFSFGVGLTLGVVNTLYPEPGKFIPAILRPLMFISGTYFSINEMPVATHDFLLWNPLLHVFEFMRSAFSESYNTTLVSRKYLALSTLVALTLGMLMFRANWRRMLRI